MTPEERCAAAKLVFGYLALADPEPASVDLVLGFGHFDPGIPKHCCDLYRRFPSARAIIFTGGVGAGTADIGQPEARYFFALARAYAPEIPEERFLLEDRSTNTAENLAFTLKLLEAVRPDLLPGGDIRSMALVANAYRQRRVFLTCGRFLKQAVLVNAPPRTSFEAECEAYQTKGLDLVSLLAGEVDRVISYGEKDWIRREPVPAEIRAARALLG